MKRRFFRSNTQGSEVLWLVLRCSFLVRSGDEYEKSRYSVLISGMEVLPRVVICWICCGKWRPRGSYHPTGMSAVLLAAQKVMDGDGGEIRNNKHCGGMYQYAVVAGGGLVWSR